MKQRDRRLASFPGTRRRLTYGIAALLLVLCLSMVATLAAAATETINVNTTADTNDLTAGDGICADATGKCSLRAAVQTANEGASTYEIKVPAGIYTLSSGNPLELRSNATVKGDNGNSGSSPNLTVIQAAAATGAANFRVFNLNPDANDTGYDITLENLTVRGGGVRDPGDFGGAGILGFTGNKTIKLHNLVIKENLVDDGLYGGGLNIAGPAGGSFVLSDTSILNNVAGKVPGVYAARAGGAYIEGDLNVSIFNAQFRDNTAYGSGGGLQAVPQSATPGTFVIAQSQFSGNKALGSAKKEGSEGRGAGIFLQRVASIQSTTFENNNADGDGGALAGELFSGSITLSDVTATGNGVYGRGGGIYVNNTGILSISSSDIQGNINLNDQSPSNIETNSDAADAVVEAATSVPSLLVAGQNAVAYGVSVRNTGKTSTAADLTVQFSPASGVTPVSLSGTGWSCDLPTLTCTTTKRLAANESSPRLDLVFNVDAGAGDTAGLEAAVAMTGENNSLNNSISTAIPVVSPVKSTLTAGVPAMTADGSSTTAINLQLKNASGGNVNDSSTSVLPTLGIAGKGTLGAVTKLGGGAYRATLTAPTELGTATIKSSVNGVGLQAAAIINFVAGEADAAKSTLAVDKTTLTADGTSTAQVTVTVRDAQGNILSDGGDNVTLVLSGSGSVGTVVDNLNGTYGAILTAPTTTGGATITAKVNDVNVPAPKTVNFIAGAANASKSTLAVDKAELTADGASTAQLTVTLRDAQGNALSAGGDDVKLALNGVGHVGTVLDNHNGTYNATLTAPTTTGAATITAKVNSTDVPGPKMVAFVAGTADASKSTLTVDKTELPADGVSTAQLKVYVRDAQGNMPSSGGASVIIEASGVGSVGIIVDNNDGTYSATLTAPTTTGTATLTAKVNGAVVPAPKTVNFIAGAANAGKSALSVDKTELIADGTSTAQLKVTVRDAQGNALSAGGEAVTLEVSGVGSVGTVVDNNDGTYTATLTAPTTTGTATLTAKVNGADVPMPLTVVFVAGAADASKSTLTVDKTELTADGVSTAQLKVTVRDAQGNKLSKGGDPVTLVLSGIGSVGTVVDNGDGTYSATLTAPTIIGSATITAKVNGTNVPGSKTVDFVVGAADASKSMLTVDKTELTADGAGTAQLKVTVRDAQGNILSAGGESVTIEVSGVGSVGTVVDNNDGTYSATLTAPTTTGTATITAKVNGASIPTTKTVDFIAGAADASKSTLTVDKTELTADGVSTAELTVTVRDAEGNALSAGGDDVKLALNGVGHVGTVVDNHNGTYNATLTAPTKTGAAILTAKVNGAAVPGPKTVAFVAGAADAATSTLTVDKTELPANGTSTAGLTVTLKDVNGNLLAGGGHTVSLEVAGIGTLGSVSDMGDGTYRAVLTAPTAAGTAEISAKAGSTLLSATASVTFIADHNAEASAIFINGAPVGGFDPKKNDYVTVVPHSVDWVTVTAQTYSPFATVTVTGATYLEVGANHLQVKVTAQDQSTSNTYLLTVVRAELELSSDARALRLAVNGADVAGFDPAVLDYTLNLPHEITSATITAQTAEPDAQVSVSGGDSLLVGSNTIEVVITAPDGATKLVYTLHIMRSAAVDPGSSSKADLASLAVDGQPITGFDPGITRYTVNVPYETTRVTVTAQVYESGATADVWGGNDLIIGNNLVAVTVTAPDGITTKRYELAVNRAAPPVVEEPSAPNPPVTLRSDNSYLAGLTVSSGVLKPGFSRDNTVYEVTVGNSVSAIQVTAHAEDPKAKIEMMSPVKGQSPLISSGGNSLGQNIALSEGDNSITITVTAEGGSRRTYSLRVNRETLQPGGTAENESGKIPGQDPVLESCTLNRTMFNDVSGNWAEREITQAGCRGLVKGYSDGGVHPNKPISRAEFITMLASALKWDEEPSASVSGFKDQESIRPWARQAIIQAVQRGITTGYQDGTFRPEAQISRAEMVVLMMRALGIKPEAGAATSFADDGGIPAWAKPYVAEAVKRGLINGRGGNKFEPSGPASRAEAIVLLLRLSNQLTSEQ